MFETTLIINDYRFRVGELSQELSVLLLRVGNDGDDIVS